MEPEDRLTKVTKASRKSNFLKKLRQRKRYVIFGVLVILAIILALLIFGGNTQQKHDQKITNMVTDLQKSGYCSSGLKKIEPYTADLKSDGGYNITTREKALNYLVQCNFTEDNKPKALSYASSLEKLYKQSGNTQKLAQLIQLINYIKTYGQ
jgi:hypothetical protein